MAKIKKNRHLQGTRPKLADVKENVVFEYSKGEGETVEVKSFKEGKLLNKVMVLALSEEEFAEITNK